MSTGNLPSFGVKEAEILFITEPPSPTDWEYKFVTSADRKNLIVKALKSVNIKESDVAFLAPCPPIPEEIKGSDKREKDFLKLHRDVFLRYLEEYKPKLIVTLGKHSTFMLVGKAVAITTERGIPRYHGDTLLLPMLGPGYMLTVPSKLPYLYSDMALLSKLKESDWDLSKINEAATLDKYEWRTDIQDIIDLKPKVISFDTETLGLRWYADGVQPITLQMSYIDSAGVQKSIASCVYKPYADKWALQGFDEQTITKLIGQWKLLLEDESIKKVAHNFKFDHHMSSKLGISIRGWYACTMQLSFVVDDNMDHRSLSDCVRRWVPLYSGYDDQFSKETDKSDMMSVSPDKLCWYGCADAYVTFQLAKVLVAEGMKDTKNWKRFTHVQMPGLIAFANTMEVFGMCINTDAMQEFTKELEKERDELYDSLCELTPKEIKHKYVTDKKPHLNFNSSHMLVDLLFSREGLKLKPIYFTKGTKNSTKQSDKVPETGKSHLVNFADHPFVDKLLRYKKVAKMISTYLGNYEEGTGMYKYIVDGKIRPSYYLSGTTTGRCLPGSALIYTQYGWTKLIDIVNQVKPYYRVWTHMWRYRTINKVHLCGSQNLLSFELSNGKTLRASYRHRLMKSNGKWAKCIDLQVGDKLMGCEITQWEKLSTQVEILSIRRLTPENTFDIEVEQDHSFIVSGVISHNSNSRDPNGQNLPKHGDLAKSYRKIFKSSEGYSFLSVDYSQAELRISAWEANEPTMIKAYKDGLDVHAITAANGIGVSLEKFYTLPADQQKHYRQGAKAENFGWIFSLYYKSFPAYAKSNYGVDISIEQAKESHDRFFGLYKKLPAWHNYKKEYARANEYVRSLIGGIRRLPDVRSKEKWAVDQALRIAINATVQGMASDMGVMALHRIVRDCDLSILRPVGFIHDALVFEVKKGYEIEYASAVKWYMENIPFKEWFGIESPVPISVDVEFGENLSDLKGDGSITAIKPSWFTSDELIYGG